MPNMAAVKQAVEEVLRLIGDADSKSMLSARKPKAVSIEVEAGGEKPMCEDCEKGMCTEHMSDEDLSVLGGE